MKPLDKHAHGKYTDLIKKIERMIDVARASNKAELQGLNKTTLIKEVNKNLKKVLSVRTILSSGSTQNLLDFYFPLEVRAAQESDVAASNFDSLSDQGPTLIVGTVGQGKSIFLRYMCFHELCHGKSIPVFLELRKLRDSTPLLSHARQKLSDLGLVFSEKLFSFMMANGFVSLFLDGFDEVAFGVREKFNQEIDMVQTRFPGCKVLVTTRPDTEVHHNLSLNAFRLQDLNKSNYPDFIRRVVKGEDDRSSLIRKVNEADVEIKEVIKTPLMMTLFISVYQSRRKLPRTYSEFFDELFSTILSRHDGLKAAYDRPSKTGLSDKNLKMGLEAFSYQARKNDRGQFSERELVGLVESSLKILGEDWRGVSPKDFIYDIKNITCLLQKDGTEYHFIHESIQNYYAASFVKSQEENKSKFYDRYLEDWHHWSPEINFLRHIDLYAFNKYFLIPSVERQFEVNNGSVDKIKLSGFRQSLEDAFVVVFKADKRKYFCKIVSGERCKNWAINEYCSFPMVRSGGEFEGVVVSCLESMGIFSGKNFKNWIEESSRSGVKVDGVGDHAVFKLAEYLDEKERFRELYGLACERCISDVQRDYRSAKKYVESKNKLVGVF